MDDYWEHYLRYKSEELKRKKVVLLFDICFTERNHAGKTSELLLKQTIKVKHGRKCVHVLSI